jgi:citrate lyase alpha subunit
VKERRERAHFKLTPITELVRRAERIIGKPETLPLGKKAVGIGAYRDGSVIGLIRKTRD